MAKLKLAPWFIVLGLIAGTLGPSVAAAGGPAEQEISIVAVSPPYGSRDVDRLETLVVRFDREVRWSDTHLAIEPDTAIEVEQTAPNEIAISPRDGWLPGTSYDVRILAGLTASDGAVLQQDFVFSFRTRAGTQLLAFEPQGEAVPTDSLVRVEFAQAPSDPAAIAASLRVWRMAGAAPVAVDGGATWETPTTIVWRPATPFVAGADYIAAIGGPGTSAARHEW
ncbi:MAG TPA: Ig-like domain-containing protein, partial [Dehalococcoidia bacterium]|nr:Ig-like domain-containing protein [Dehalococcoidia bacterium]